MQNCYSGRVSCDAAVEQDDRLTTKHIHTLQFLQEIVKENKDLKAKVGELEHQMSSCAELHIFAENAKEKIKQIQEQYLKRADEINQMLLEKHRVEMMKRVEENLSNEKRWQDEKSTLLAEIERLNKEVVLMKEELDSAMEQKEQIEILQLKVVAQQNEIDRLNGDVSRSGQASQNQISEIQRLKFVEKHNKNLKEELDEMIQKNKELQYKILKLQSDLSDQKVSEQDELMNSLKEKIKKVLQHNKVLDDQHKEDGANLDELKAENANLRKALTDSEKMRMDLRAQMEELLKEILQLKKQLSTDRDKQAFKDFVKLKREMQLLQVENEDLRTKLRLTIAGNKGLPSIKSSEASSTSITSLASHSSSTKRRESGYSSQYPHISKTK